MAKLELDIRILGGTEFKNQLGGLTVVAKKILMKVFKDTGYNGQILPIITIQKEPFTIPNEKHSSWFHPRSNSIYLSYLGSLRLLPNFNSNRSRLIPISYFLAYESAKFVMYKNRCEIEGRFNSNAKAKLSNLSICQFYAREVILKNHQIEIPVFDFL